MDDAVRTVMEQCELMDRQCGCENNAPFLADAGLWICSCRGLVGCGGLEGHMGKIILLGFVLHKNSAAVEEIVPWLPRFMRLFSCASCAHILDTPVKESG